MGLESAIGAGVSAAASLGGAAISAGGQGKAASLAEDAQKFNRDFGMNVFNSATTQMIERANNARSDLNTGRQDAYNALVRGLERTDPLYAEWDNAYNTGRSDIGNALAQVRSDNKAYTDLGAQGAAGYSALLTNPSSIKNDPGYQFRLDQGRVALDRSAASKGQLFSGGAQAAQQEYGQNYAANELGNALSRYNTAMTQGQAAQGRVDAAGQQSGNALANLGTQRAAAKSNLGQFQASLYQNTGNVLAGLQSQMASNEQWAGGKLADTWTNLYRAITGNETDTSAQQGQAYANQSNAWSQGLGGVGNAISGAISNYAYDKRGDDLNNYWKSYYGG